MTEPGTPASALAQSRWGQQDNFLPLSIIWIVLPIMWIAVPFILKYADGYVLVDLFAPRLVVANVMVWLAYMLYVPTSMHLLRIYVCEDIDQLEGSRLAADMNVSCNSAEHVTFMLLALPSTIGFVIFFPVWMFHHIQKNLVHTSDTPHAHERYIQLKEAEHMFQLTDDWKYEYMWLFTSFFRNKIRVYTRAIWLGIMGFIIFVYAFLRISKSLQADLYFLVLAVWTLKSFLYPPFRCGSSNVLHLASMLILTLSTGFSFVRAHDIRSPLGVDSEFTQIMETSTIVVITLYVLWFPICSLPHFSWPKGFLGPFIWERVWVPIENIGIINARQLFVILAEVELKSRPHAIEDTNQFSSFSSLPRRVASMTSEDIEKDENTGISEEWDYGSDDELDRLLKEKDSKDIAGSEYGAQEDIRKKEDLEQMDGEDSQKLRASVKVSTRPHFSMYSSNTGDALATPKSLYILQRQRGWMETIIAYLYTCRRSCGKFMRFLAHLRSSRDPFRHMKNTCQIHCNDDVRLSKYGLVRIDGTEDACRTYWRSYTVKFMLPRMVSDRLGSDGEKTTLDQASEIFQSIKSHCIPLKVPRNSTTSSLGDIEEQQSDEAMPLSIIDLCVFEIKWLMLLKRSEALLLHVETMHRETTYFPTLWACAEELRREFYRARRMRHIFAQLLSNKLDDAARALELYQHCVRTNPVLQTALDSLPTAVLAREYRLALISPKMRRVLTKIVAMKAWLGNRKIASCFPPEAYKIEFQSLRRMRQQVQNSNFLKEKNWLVNKARFWNGSKKWSPLKKFQLAWAANVGDTSKLFRYAPLNNQKIHYFSNLSDKDAVCYLQSLTPEELIELNGGTIRRGYSEVAIFLARLQRSPEHEMPDKSEALQLVNSLGHLIDRWKDILSTAETQNGVSEDSDGVCSGEETSYNAIISFSQSAGFREMFSWYGCFKTSFKAWRICRRALQEAGAL